MITNFRTYQLAKDFYLASAKLKLPVAMRDQFSRASLSVVLNLAEGVGKATPNDRRRFYDIAMGSLRECQAILDLAGQEQTLKQADAVAASLFRLIQNPGGR